MTHDDIRAAQPRSRSARRAVRRFTRFYTRRSACSRRTSEDPFSLTEGRVLYELAHREPPPPRRSPPTSVSTRLSQPHPARLRRSRPGDEKARAGRRAPEPDRDHGERPQSVRAAQQGLERSGRRAARRLPTADQERSSARCARWRNLLGRAPKRPPQGRSCCGRIGRATWAGSRPRTASLYAQEYGWDITLSRRWSRRITAEFIENFDPKRERCWIAEMDGETRRLGVRGAQDRRDRKAAPAHHRAEGARHWPRQAAGRRMPRFAQRRPDTSP